MGERPTPSVKPVDPQGPNVSKDGIVVPAATTPNVSLLNTDGTFQAEAGGFVPDPNAAVVTAQIVETTNRRCSRPVRVLSGPLLPRERSRQRFF